MAATNGVTVLALADSAAASPYGSRWLLWWLGDATGALLVAPLILVWATRPPLRIPARRLAEGAVVLAALAGLAALIFLGGLWRYPYLLFPLLLWAAVRFTQLGAVTASFTVAAFGVAGVISANVPLGGRDETVAVEILQSLLAVTAISLLALGASISERDSAAESLRQAAVGLAEAQALAHIGSWEWDIAGDRVTWSNELYRIYDLQPERGELNYEAYLSRIHPGDRDRVRSTIAVALEEGHAFEMTHRAVLGDGSERIVQGRGRVILDRAGHPVRMVGTSQDITERERVEQVRENILSAVSHELRTPLTAILGFAITLRERWPTLTDEGREEMIGLVASQATRLERLLNDLLDVDRLRHGRLRVDFEHADLAELVRTVVAGRPDGREIDVQAAERPRERRPGQVRAHRGEPHRQRRAPHPRGLAHRGVGCARRNRCAPARGRPRPRRARRREGDDLPGLHARQRGRGDRSRGGPLAGGAVRRAARGPRLGRGQPGRRRLLPRALPGHRRLSGLRCRGWEQEGALRCLLNNLDPAVAEDPDVLVVYGGRGKAARSKEALAEIVSALERLGPDETLDRPVGQGGGRAPDP